MRLVLPQLEPGQLLAGYRVERMLGRGGMGVVYRATQLSLKRTVALKLLSPELQADETFRARFRQEAELLASLEHPHVLPLYEAGEQDGLLFLAMRYVEGEDLGALLAAGPLRLERACRIAGQLAAALQAAGERGLVHRDVKPANVLLTGKEGDEHAYLTDFGLARSLEGRGLTRTGEFLGSVDYLAPEQIEHGKADSRSDIYALGCLLYACLTGSPPFAREQEAATLWAHLNAEPPRATELHPELPAALDDVIAAALAKDPGQRHQTAGELAHALDEALAGKAPAAPRARKGAAKPKINLPLPATPFLGRARELADVGALLIRDDLRLLTLTGPGGTGKTRLALEAASVLGEHYPEGIWWVPLAPLGDPSLVLATVAQVLGTKRELTKHIGTKRLLLLLDNFEHLMEAAAELGAVLAACPNITVLVTSRERLQLAGEHEYAVPPLAPPDGVALFLTRTRALGGDFEADSPTRELCDRLDNLPLALELAAARTKLFAPAQLLERLGQRLDLFKGGRDADPRQRTLRATIEWSYDLLNPDEQTLFARLSVFAGGCTFDAAHEICDTDEDLLQSLLDKSLLRRREGPDGKPRFWMLETIRQFAGERLSEQDPDKDVQRRHTEWYARLGERIQEPMRAGDARSTSRVVAELDNLRAGLEWAAQHGEPRDGFGIVWALWYFWWTRGLAGEGLRWAQWAVAEGDKLSPSERVFGLLGASELIHHFGDVKLALRIKHELLPVLGELDHENHVAATLADMAEMTAHVGDFEEARRLADDALALQQKLGTPSGIAHALGARGIIEFYAGDFALARSFYEQSLVFAEESANNPDLAGCTLMIAECARRTGDVGEAKRQLRQAAELSVEARERSAFPEILQEAAALADLKDAARLLAAAERLEEEMGTSRWDAADCDETLATVRRALPAVALDAAWQEGRSLSDEEAMALAVKSLD
jgi:predicted ATPase/predicted Ser/Thr protein kinase